MYFNANLRFVHVYTPPPQTFVYTPPPCDFQNPRNNRDVLVIILTQFGSIFLR